MALHAVTIAFVYFAQGFSFYLLYLCRSIIAVIAAILMILLGN